MEIEQKGLFITVEGIEGAGKSTVIRRVQKELLDLGLDTILTREPGGTPSAEQLRNVVFQNELGPEAETLLMYACRIDHCNKLIRPALAEGKIVLSDRYYDSTFAYQGVDCPNLINTLHANLLDNNVIQKPDLTLVFDISVDCSIDRLSTRGVVSGEEKNQFEERASTFFKAARDLYLLRASREPHYVVIDAEQEIDAVVNDVLYAINRIIGSLPAKRIFKAKKEFTISCKSTAI